MKILIVEDEQVAANRLMKLVLDIEPKATILGPTDTISGTVSLLQTNVPDLILLDIHLADGSSFRIFEQATINCPIIFTTAYDQYAIQAFKVNSVDYLLKPIKRDELVHSIEKFHKYHGGKAEFPDITALLNALQKKEIEYQQRFVVQFADKIKAISCEEIAYFYARDKAVYLVCKSGHEYGIDYTLERLIEVINPKQFFRINRRFIINYSAIKNMYVYSKSRVKIELEPATDQDTIVSTERSSEFKNWLDR